MLKMRNLLASLLLMVPSTPVFALRDDVLIIVNDNSIDSPSIGAYYAQQRDIDPANIVHVRVPNSYFISWTQFHRLRDQLIHFMQVNTLDDPALTPVPCSDGEPPFYCPASMEQLRLHTKIRYVVTTLGVPTRMLVDGSTLASATAPSSVDNYLKYWLVNYFADDVRLDFNEREAAFGDGRGMRQIRPDTDRELIVGRVDGLNRAAAQALVDRALRVEQGGFYGRLFGTTNFLLWENHSLTLPDSIIYPRTGFSSSAWHYQLGLFGEARQECIDYLDQPGALAEGKAPVHCAVQLNEDSNPASRVRYPAPGNAGSRQPRAIDALIYHGWLDGQAAAGSFDALLNWRKDDQCTVSLCADAADPAACRAASTDVFAEINTDCVGVADGFMGYNHQSWPVSYFTVWPSDWSGPATGDVDQLAFPEVRGDAGFDDNYSLWFRNSDQVADPRCFTSSDFSAPANTPCVDGRRIILTQSIPLTTQVLNTANPQTYRVVFRYKTGNTSVPTTLGVHFRVHETGAGSAQLDYGVNEAATLALGDTDWTLAQVQFQLVPALHSAASYDALEVTIETGGVFAGDLGIDVISVQEVSSGVELASNGSFNGGHRQVATGDHAATFLDRLGGTAFWGSVGHHQSGGCAFCFNGLETLIYFMRGLPLGDAVWFNESNNSGILYGDPLYSPVAVRLNPVNDTDTVSGRVPLYGSALNGRDVAQVSTSYAIDVCPGSDFFTCDQNPTSWSSTGISGARRCTNALLGTWDTTSIAPGAYTLRLAVTSQNVVSGRSQTLYDYYPVTVSGDSLQFGATDYSVSEEGASVLITVTRTGASATAGASVDYATSDSSAVSGSDYTAVAGTLNFAAGEISQSFSVPVLNDVEPEGDETFVVSLANGVGANVGSPATANVRIVDNDALPSAHAPVLDNSGINGLVLMVGSSVTVNFAVSDADPGDSATFAVSSSALGSASFSGNALTYVGGSAGSEILAITVTDTTGLNTSLELPITVNETGSSDSNADGLTDVQATANGLDPSAPDGDSDGDTIPDAMELGDPFAATDSDSDGVIDALEVGGAGRDPAQLSLVVTPEAARGLGLDSYAGSEVILSVTAGAALTALPNSMTGLPLFMEADFPTADPQFDFPEGLYSYAVSLPAGQPSVAVTIQLPPGPVLPDNAVVRKLDIAGSWQTVGAATIDRVNRSITLTLVDNDGLFDVDSRGGVIGDPVGIGLPVSSASATPTDSGGGGGGGCVLRPEGLGRGYDPWAVITVLVAAAYLLRARRQGAVITRF